MPSICYKNKIIAPIFFNYYFIDGIVKNVGTL